MADWKSLFGAKLQTKNGEVDTIEALSNKDAVAIYFSAHWCPPCRNFTPVFAGKYKQLIDAGKNFECVFASSDSDEPSFNAYYNEMPWLALPYKERDLKGALGTKFGCRGIPMLVILDGKTGEVITKNGRGAVSTVNFMDDYPWYPKEVYDISESMDGIEEEISFILVQDFLDPETRKINSERLLAIAKSNDKKTCKLWFTANGGPGPIDFIKEEFHLTSCNSENTKAPIMLIINVKMRLYYKPLEGKAEFNEANVQEFIKDFNDKKCVENLFQSAQ